MINIDTFWDDAKDELSKLIQTINYEIWVDSLVPVCIFENSLILQTSSKNAKKSIDSRFRDTIKDVVSTLNSSITDIQIIIPEQREEFLKKQTDFLENSGFVTVDPATKNTDETKNVFLKKYSFDSFVQGKSNSYALAACKTVAEHPGDKFNPLFIYSGVGLGKTHLLNAIGNYTQEIYPKKKVLYVTSDKIVSELISVILNKNNDESNRFREKYRSCDVLMIDDIQFLAGKEATQENLFHIFNDLHQSNKQIIITSDKAPKDLTVLEERLRTRFSWGLTVDIQPPDTETRVAILKTKALQEKFLLSDEVALFIAENAPSNIREMEGLLNKIIFFSSLTNHPINTKELAFEALHDFIEEKTETITSELIISTVSKYFKIPTADLFSSKKTKNIVEPRMIAIYLISELLSMPLSAIGDIFGGKHHATIIHARDKIANDIKSNNRLKIIVADLKSMIINI